MKNKLYILLIAFISCETVVVPQLPEDNNEMVVYSFFRPNQPIRFDLFNNSSLLDPIDINPIVGSSIILFENGEQIETIVENMDREYIGNTIPQTNRNYRFEIQSGGKSIRGESIVPEAISIEKIGFSLEIKDVNLGEYGYPASVTFTDPVDQNNFYAVEVFVENCDGNCSDQQVTGELNELLLEEIKLNNSGNTDITISEGPEGIEGIRYVYLADQGFNGERFTLNFYIIPTLIDPEENNNVQVRFVLKSLTEEYYNYLQTSDYQLQIEEEGSLAEPVQIYSNIDNALGLFAGYNIDVMSFHLSELDRNISLQ